MCIRDRVRGITVGIVGFFRRLLLIAITVRGLSLAVATGSLHFFLSSDGDGDGVVIYGCHLSQNGIFSVSYTHLVQEQVQAPVRYLCDKDFSNFRLLANARVIVPEVEGIQLKKIRSRNFSSEEMERMEKALMKGGAFYEIRQGFDYDTEIDVYKRQVEDNLKTFGNFEPLTEKEEKIVEGVAAAIKARTKNGCTGCAYCMPCLLYTSIR